MLKIIYAPLKQKKKKNQIVYLSRQRNQKDIDIELLEKAIKDTENYIKILQVHLQ